MSRRVILDSEAVQALMSVEHPKHRRALALVEAALSRRRGRTMSGAGALVVPTAVRVEAEWDRTVARAAILNRLRVADHALDRTTADCAASVRAALRVSVADAHIGALLADSAEPSAVITSDLDDVQRIVSHLGADAIVVRL